MQNESTHTSGMDDISRDEFQKYAWDEAAKLGASTDQLRLALDKAEGKERWAVNTKAADLLVQSSGILEVAEEQKLSPLILGTFTNIQRELHGILRMSSEHGKYRRGGSEWTGGKEYVA